VLQFLLNQHGYSAGTPDGIFGTNTQAAVEKYQKANGLTVDGICGKNTWGKLLA
jgi:peptidoglycan hydrolase-like protein with peptidoglycan-binding domain